MPNRRTEIETRIASIDQADRTPRQQQLVDQAKAHAEAIARTAQIDNDSN